MRFTVGLKNNYNWYKETNMPKEKMRKKARKDVLKKLKGVMSDDMHSPMKDSMQKVSVSSDSKEGLKKGLDKAQDILGKRKGSYQDGGTKPMDMDDFLKKDKEYANKDMSQYKKDPSPAAVESEEEKKKKKK